MIMEGTRKPGTQTIPAFDANYFVPGTVVATTIVSNDGSLGQTRIGIICGYTSKRQDMRLNYLSLVTGERLQYEITIEDYMSGRVVITRMVNEEPEEPAIMKFQGRAYNDFNSQTAYEGLVAVDETSPHVKAMVNDVYVFPDYVARYWNGLEWVSIPQRMQVLKEAK